MVVLPNLPRRAAVFAAVALLALLPVVAGGLQRAQAAPAGGYWLVAQDGGIFSFGDATFHGSTGAIRLNQPITGMASTPSGNGYWLVASDGGIFSFGDAAFRGSTGSIKLNKPIVGMASTPSGNGYWLVASDGGIFAFGDAKFFGSTGSIKLNKPIVGMASTPAGNGYWLVASDGGIFSYGDAKFFGSTGAIKLNQPITNLASTPSGGGYWLTAVDGGIFAFGDAAFFGAAPQKAPRPGTTRKIVAMVPTATGKGYWQASSAGEMLAFGDAADFGAPPSSLNKDLVGMAGLGRVTASSSPPPPPPPGSPPAPTTTTTAPMLAGPPQFFSSNANPTWGTSPSEVEDKKAGRVLALAEAGDKVFLAGEFAGLTPPGVSSAAAKKDPSSIVARPFLAAIDRNSGALLDWDAHPDNAVLSLQVSPDGRKLYVGGRFRNIGGAPAGRIAALDVDTGKADPTFKPPLADSGVKAMKLFGNTLYIGGDFTAIGDVKRPQLAAVDATSGALATGWVPPASHDGCYKGHTGTPTSGCDGLVEDMAISADGSTLYVVGDFRDFGGQGGILAVDAATGKASSWQADNDRPIFGVTIWPGDGKSVVVSTGGTGGQVQFFDRSSSSTKPKWIHRVDGDATDVVATTERVYLVGHYDYVLGKNTTCGQSSCFGGNPGDEPNRHISVFDAKTGAHDLGFTGQLNTPQGPYVALVGKQHLYIGGDFTEANENPQPGFVQFTATG